MKTFAAAAMIAGTCIGAGMLALPVSVAAAGIGYGLVAMLFAWLFMTLGGLYIARATLASRRSSMHLLSLSKEFIGPWSAWIVSPMLVLILLGSMVAYLSEGGKIINEQFGLGDAHMMGSLVLSGLFIGAQCCAVLVRFNSLLFSILLILFATLLGLLVSSFDFQMLVAHSMANGEAGPARTGLLPLMLTVFSYPGIVPGFVSYLDFDGRKIDRAIWLGTTMGLVLYVVWLVAVFGLVQPVELLRLYQADRSVIQVLASVSDNSELIWVARMFGSLAIVTSFLGLGWSLVNFILDSLQREDRSWHVGATILTSVVALVLFYSCENVFFTILESTGGIGDSLASGIAPALMMLSLPMVKHWSTRRGVLTVVVIFFLSVAALEVYQLLR